MEDGELRALFTEMKRGLADGKITWLIWPLDGRADPGLIARDLARFPAALADQRTRIFGPCVGMGRVSLALGRDLPRTPRAPGLQSRRNARVRAPLIQLYGPSGRELGLTTNQEARAIAALLALDLVELANGCPSICQILNYGLRRYDEKRRTEVEAGPPPRPKEVRLRPSSAPDDLERRVRKARSFLRKGYPVVLRFVPRERERRSYKRYLPAMERGFEALRAFGRERGEPWSPGRFAWSARFEPLDSAQAAESPTITDQGDPKAFHLAFPFDVQRRAETLTEVAKSLAGGAPVALWINGASWLPERWPSRRDLAFLAAELAGAGAPVGEPVYGLRSLVLRFRPFGFPRP